MHFTKNIILLVSCLCTLLLCNCTGTTETYQIYVGTYTDKAGEGIYKFSYANDTISEVALVAKLNHPEYLVFNKKADILYTVAQVDSLEGQKNALLSYQVATNGELNLIDVYQTHTKYLTHLSLSKDEKTLATVSFRGQDVMLFEVINGKFSKLDQVKHGKGSEVKMPRQADSHPHSAFFDENDQRLFVPDLGMDKVVVYNIANNSLDSLTSVAFEPGGGPRHFSYQNTTGYTNNEMTSTIAAFDLEDYTAYPSVSSLPKDYKGKNSTAQIIATKNNLYVSNRGHNSIAVFNIKNKTPELIQHITTRGRTPRNFSIDKSESILVVGNKKSDNVIIYTIDKTTGMLTDTGLTANIPNPACIAIVNP